MVSPSEKRESECVDCLAAGEVGLGVVRPRFCRSLCRRHYLRRYHAECRAARRARGPKPCTGCGTRGGKILAGTAIPIRYAGGLCHACRWPSSARERRRVRRQVPPPAPPAGVREASTRRPVTPDPSPAEIRRMALEIRREHFGDLGLGILVEHMPWRPGAFPRAGEGGGRPA